MPIERSRHFRKSWAAWFRAPRSFAYQQGAVRERERIVAFLQNRGDRLGARAQDTERMISAITSGEHIKGSQE